MIYDPKSSSSEDQDNLDKLMMDEQHGIITAYEMRIRQGKPSKGEATFKVSKGSKNHEHISNERISEKSNEEEENFIKKLKKGSDKYKGNLHFKCFNCGKIGHFSSKFSYPKEKDSDDEESYN